MSETARIADALRRSFHGEAWHGDSLFEVLKGVTPAQASARPIQNAHTIWELVLHLVAWEDAVQRRMTGVVVELNDAENFPPVTDRRDAAWQKALEHARHVHAELIAAVEKFPEASLAKQVPGKEGAHYNFAYMLHGLAQHAAYHSGQIVFLKKM